MINDDICIFCQEKQDKVVKDEEEEGKDRSGTDAPIIKAGIS